MDIVWFFLFIIATIFVVILISKLRGSKKQYQELYDRYKDIIDLDGYKEQVTKETEDIIDKNNTSINDQKNQISLLQADYATKHAYFKQLLKEISLYEEQQEIISYGLYAPHFDYDTSEKYKQALESIRNKEKEMIKFERAAIARKEWTIDGNRAEGKKVTKQYIKLMLRAFNGECEALVADVRWNNIQRMEERLQKAYEAINKLASGYAIDIVDEYYRLKLDELRLTHEYREKIQQEKEEQRRIQERIREEEKAQREIDKTLKETEDEEKRYNKALEQARKEMEKATGEQLAKLQEKMSQLQKELEEAQKLKERALSMAQQTKAGHVYVISNIGSFGENVFKIGMTRRLEPMDRIKELGDASVPFNFDVHAIIYSENAPELENLLHKEFDFNKVNLVNDRREFFNVTIEEIQRAVKEFKGDIEITKLAEAREYRESMQMRLSRDSAPEPVRNPVLDRLPASI